MAIVLIWDPLERLLGGISITLGFIMAILYLYRSRERTIQSERHLVSAFGILVCGATILLIFYYFLQFLLPGSFIQYTFYIDDSTVDLNYNIVERLGWVVFFIIYSLYVFFQERIVIKRTKYSLSIILMVFIFLLSITLTYDIFDTIQTLCYGFLGLVVTIMIIIMTRRSRVEFKAVGAFLIAALVMNSLSIRLLSLPFKELNLLPLFLPQLFLITGWILGMIPFLIKSSRLERAKDYWIANIILILIYLTFIFILYLLVGEFIKLLTLTIYFIISIYAGFDTLKSLKPASLVKDSPELQRDTQSVLEPFVRPQKITEEEVSISKEKRVCLVCKANLERAMYMCPECQTFYCQKCSNTLMGLENACWFCNTPFDQSKPSKPFDRDEPEEKIELSDKINEEFHMKKM